MYIYVCTCIHVCIALWRLQSDAPALCLRVHSSLFSFLTLQWATTTTTTAKKKKKKAKVKKMPFGGLNESSSVSWTRCSYVYNREKEPFFLFFFSVKKVHLSFFFFEMWWLCQPFLWFSSPIAFLFLFIIIYLLIFFFSPFSSFFFVFSLYLPLLYRLASSCLSNMHVFFFLVSLPYSSVSFLGIAFSVFLVVLCFPLSSFFFSPFFSFSSCSGDVGGKVCVRFFFFKVRNRE